MNLSDRMKLYERLPATTLMPRLPVMIRLDGRSFHTYTRQLRRPYDERLSSAMIDAMTKLMEETHAKVGYTQSDEITLCLYSPDPRSQLLFGGKVQKLTSVLASMLTAAFAPLVVDIPELKGKTALFDCRVWNVPSLAEAVNVFVWREQDAVRNSIQSAARAHYSHKQCDGKNTQQMLDMLNEHGVKWGDYPDFFKYGTFALRRSVKRQLSVDELERIPEQHRPPAGTEFDRTKIKLTCFRWWRKMSNKVDVLFDSAEPVFDE